LYFPESTQSPHSIRQCFDSFNRASYSTSMRFARFAPSSLLLLIQTKASICGSGFDLFESFFHPIFLGIIQWSLSVG
jgi:hypothetical protein